MKNDNYMKMDNCMIDFNHGEKLEKRLVSIEKELDAISVNTIDLNEHLGNELGFIRGRLDKLEDQLKQFQVVESKLRGTALSFDIYDDYLKVQSKINKINNYIFIALSIAIFATNLTLFFT